MTVIQTGSIVILAYVFGDYLASIAPAGAFGPMLYAGGAVLALSFANWAGVKLGSQVQLWLTVLEVGGLVALIVAAFSLAPAESVGAAANAPASANWGLMLVFVLFTYSGWNEVAYVSAEVRGPPRRIGVLIVAGLAAVSLLYLLANVALLRALGVAGVAAAPAVGSEIMQRAWGPAGAAFIALIVAVAALTSANATAITGARSNCALGRSVPAMRWLGHWHEDRGTPANAILVQGAIALLLVAIGGFARDGFKTAIDYTAPVFWFFLLLVGLSLFVLRMREPTRERPFRVPLYPLLPALFCATSLYLLYSSIAYTGFGALVGVAVLAAGALLLPLLRPAAQLERMHEDTR
jgi:amino acid transporter